MAINCGNRPATGAALVAMHQKQPAREHAAWRLQHSPARCCRLDCRPAAHQPGSRAPLSAWRHSRIALGHGRSFRGRSDATRLHAAGSRRGHQRQLLLNRDLSPRDLLPTSLMLVAHQKVAGATPRLPNLFSSATARQCTRVGIHRCQTEFWKRADSCDGQPTTAGNSSQQNATSAAADGVIPEGAPQFESRKALYSLRAQGWF